MNASQRTIVAVAAINLVLMFLFPPHDSLSLWRGGIPTLDGFYFVFDRHFNKQTNGNLLTLEMIWLFANVTLAWLFLRNDQPGQAMLSRRAGVVAFVVMNLALVLFFPPLENYASMTRVSGTWFDGFYFVFGDKWQRRFYLPLLYIEVLWVLVNGALLWLLFRDSSQQQEEAQA